MAKDAISYDKAELRAITRSFKAMDDEALSQGIAQLRDELSTRFRCYVDPMRYA